MAEIKIDYKRLLSKININRSLYILAFILIIFLLSIYSIVINQNGREELQKMYALKEKQDHFETIQSSFVNQIQNAFIYSQLYFSDNKELFRFQALEALNDANLVYNELFTSLGTDKEAALDITVQLREDLLDYEKRLLAKLATKSVLPEMEIADIFSDEDTLSQDLSMYEPTGQAVNINFAEEIDVIKKIESGVFELSVLISSSSQRRASELSDQGIISGKLFGLYVFFILLVLLIIYYTIKYDSQKRIKKSSEYLKLISTGELPKKQEVEKDDFAEIVENSNYITDYMHDASEFALNIGDGNFQYQFSPKSKNDTLGNSLIQMRDKLQDVAIADNVRNWTNEGQAKFGEILRDSGSDLEEMGDKILSNLVDYVEASMGVMYIKNDNEVNTKLELLSAFALNRKKHEERELNIGEGLAGQVFVEKKKVFLKEIKTDHFNIVTGMGESKPTSVLIVPLKDENNDVEGVLELASFQTFKEHQINFIEKLGESIASAIKSGKNNSVTKHLLEEMQTREEEMKTQEEELKQNMEELSATQEQLERLRKEDAARKEELEGKRKTLYNMLDGMENGVFLKDTNGKYVYVNARYSDLMNLTIGDIIGKSDFELLGEEEATKRENWEKSVLSTNVAIKESEEIKGNKYSLSINSIEIPHLDTKGTLGVLT